MATNHILVVDDEPDIRTLVQEILEDEGYQVSVAEDGAAARQALQHRRPDLILLDIWMPDIDGISLLKEWAEGGRLPSPVIMMSGHGTVETAVEATRLGAYDFLEKPLSLAKLLLTVERALEADRLYRENIGLRQQSPQLLEPVGKSAAMVELKEQARRIAQHSAWVLITGEPGSGKATLARYFHAQSSRKDAPFVEVHVGSIARANSAVELFGSEENSTIHYGHLEQANGGTLFLDDAADMDPETQSQLYSALEAQSFMRVGGTKPVEVDLRVIAATRCDLAEEVRAGRFREDLYYRLNVVPVHVPPLREHREDVPDLLNFYLDETIDREHLPYRRLTMAAQNRLRNYDWPGNIRELKNLVQRLLILSTAEEIDVPAVDAALGASPTPPGPDVHPGESAWFELPLKEAREQFERAYLEHHLQQADGSVGKLAKLVGMERTNLYRKLKSLGIEIR
jgi:DNA-binding NtrC family response regulator